MSDDESFTPDFLETDSDGQGSFAEAMGKFAKIFEIETKICDYLDSTQVPYKATREMLRKHNKHDLSSDRVLSLLKKILISSNIGGAIDVSLKSQLVYDFTVSDCNVCKGNPKEGSPVCYTTSSAIGRFFKEVLHMGCEVEEITCTKTGSPVCVHRVTLEQIDAFSIIPNSTDLVLINAIENGADNKTILLKCPGLQAEEIDGSLAVLDFYKVLEISGDDISETKLTRPLKIYAENAPPEKEEALKSWDDFERIENAVSDSKSLAEVFTTVSEEDKPPWEKDDSTDEGSTPEGEAKDSFAEMFKSLAD